MVLLAMLAVLGISPAPAGMVATATAAHAAAGTARLVARRTTPRPAPASEAPVVASASGETLLQVDPPVVRAHDVLSVRLRSRRLAAVALVVTYPDGQTVQRQGRTTAGGVYTVKIPVQYEPIDRSAVASLQVTVTKGLAFSDVVSTTFTVVRQAMLSGATLVVHPLSVRTGQTLQVIVRAGLPYVQVHVAVLDPSSQTVSMDGSTDATGMFTTTVPVSYSPRGQAHAELVVTALLSYQGQTRLLQRRVPFVGK